MIAAATNPQPVVGRGEQTGEGIPRLSPVTFSCPVPPSVNAMFKNTRRGRARTEAYEVWRMEAAAAIRRQQVPAFKGRVLVNMAFEIDLLRADADNRIKAMNDLLVEIGVIQDDSLIPGGLFSKLPPTNGTAHIQIWPAQSVTATFYPSQDGMGGGWIINMPTSEQGD
ncbi:RusA family crossover junction endodeoxyribonuclease [Aureimonas ureilytica]|uniref:RusA family crossover junction endodeoxyribonuclease n=1 Tax=Aureimonas ureilytica TaxID=401562 RepID=UPI0009DBB6EE|nr:RusA family crossover junction endodeoxyribonuclease [Aureimonas ureilytica]